MKVLDPEMKSSVTPGHLATRPANLNGATVWFLDSGREGDDDKFSTMNRIFQEWMGLLQQDFQLKAVHRAPTTNVATPFRHGKEKFEQIVASSGVVINGGAVSGSTTSCAIHDAIQFEREGIPTVTMAHDDLESAARTGSAVLGIPDLPIVYVPTLMDRNDALQEKVTEIAHSLYPSVVQALCSTVKSPARS